MADYSILNSTLLMKVNLLCDKYGEARKNPMIIIEPDAMQQVMHSLSIEEKISKVFLHAYSNNLRKYHNYK